MDIKIVIADPKKGKCKQVEVPEADTRKFYGMEIGDTLKGDMIGYNGYEFLITGGSDFCGFPMRKDIIGIRRKTVLAVEGVGIKKKGKGVRQRKTVAPRTITEETAQLNVKVVKYGNQSLFEEPKTEDEGQ